MNSRNSGMAGQKQQLGVNQSEVEEVIAQKLADITTILHSANGGTSRLHERILSLVEKTLFIIALERNNHVKGAAASYLGINRNTFQKKMVKLGIDDGKKDQG
jgi:DNA-binding protein Fis